MRRRFGLVLATTALLGGCGVISGEPPTQTFSVFFPSYSAELDQQALDAIQNAADFAKRHPLQPLILIGYAAPPDPGKDVPDLSEKRAAAVQTALVGDGVAPKRISIAAQGVVEPKTNMPSISVRRVDISVGNIPAQ